MTYFLTLPHKGHNNKDTNRLGSIKRSWPKKGFTLKEESLRINLITISMNYMLTPINAIIFNALAQKRTYHFIPCQKISDR